MKRLNDKWFSVGLAGLISAGCASGQESQTSLGATTLPMMTGAGQDTGSDDDDDDDDDGFDVGDDDDNDDRNDDNDDRNDDDGDTTGGDDRGTTGDGDGSTGEVMDSGDDGGPTSTLLIHFNVDGAFLSAGEDNAPLWESQIISESEDVPAYGDAGRASQIQSAFEAIVDDYPFDIVNEDPGVDEEYTMILLTDVSPGSMGLPSSVLSIAASDCGNENLNNVILVFDQDSQSNPVERVANSIAFSLGAAAGLNANSSAGDAMNNTADDNAATFRDECLAINNQACPIMPAGLCNAGEQNSHEALEAAFP